MACTLQATSITPRSPGYALEGAPGAGAGGCTCVRRGRGGRRELPVWLLGQPAARLTLTPASAGHAILLTHTAHLVASLFICPAPFVVCELLHGHGYVLFKFAFSFFREMPGAHTVLDECWADRGAPSGQEQTAGRRRPLSLGLCCGVDRSITRSLNIDGAPARPQASRPWESERHLRLGEESSSRDGAPVPSLSHSRRPRRGAEW